MKMLSADDRESADGLSIHR